ncbi:PTS sugar transporter subunit IIA [Erysipelothrix aquatica]|uniref:PTS sugar transporter subunit IIA n=1 Tax=Erysipelothrix aquatica TaxID=2683714 RepID=UPI001359C3E4|nr:PTS glucose transporter subunit IIA [Erysipelothrix aquatica]
MLKKLFGKKELEFFAPVSGRIIPLTEVSDPVFASFAMGDGFAVIPMSHEIYAPVSGTVVAVFPTKHAIGIKTLNGTEVLIHIGIDTVTLQGKGFNNFVDVGDEVTENSKIATVELALLQDKNIEATTMVIVTNQPTTRFRAAENHNDVNQGQRIHLQKI